MHGNFKWFADIPVIRWSYLYGFVLWTYSMWVLIWWLTPLTDIFIIKFHDDVVRIMPSLINPQYTTAYRYVPVCYSLWITWASLRLKSSTTRLFVPQPVQVNSKETSEVFISGPLWEDHRMVVLYKWFHGPLAWYVQSWVAHAPGMPGTFSMPPTSKGTTS